MKKHALFYALIVTFCLLSGCSKQITEQEAKEIALSHAGLTESLITSIIVELDTDDINHHYDVEFITTNQQEYQYEIDCSNGRILEWDAEPIHDGEL